MKIIPYSRLIKDRALGKTIASMLMANMEEPVSPCPDIEDLAAFAEGRLDKSELPEMVSHISKCPDCYEIVNETIVRIHDDKKRRRRTIYRVVSVPLALAASILLFVHIHLFDTETQAPSAATMVAMLAQGNSLSHLSAPYLASSRGGPLNSEAVLELRNTAFRLGYIMAGQEICLRNRQGQAMHDQLLQLLQIPGIEKAQGILDAVRQMERSMPVSQNGLFGSTEWLEIEKLQRNLVEKTEAWLQEEEVFLFYRAGEWCSMAKAVLATGDKTLALVFFQPSKPEVDALGELLSEKNLPEEYVDIITDIQRLLSEQMRDDDETQRFYQDLYQSIDKLILKLSS